MHRIYRRRPWLLVFLGFFLVFGAWAFAAPFDGPADEVQHVIRAAGVVSGQIAPKPAEVEDGMHHQGMGAYQRVPVGLLNHADCWGFDPHKSAACAKPLSGGPVEPVPTSAGRYNPLYYAMVGLPVRLWPSWGGLVLSRLISAALSAALLAWAFMVLLRWSRHGLMFAGLVAAATPMLAHLAGAVNPNGLEIAAGIGLFSAGIPLLLGPARGPRAPAIWLFGVSAVLLATLRSLGPAWLFFGLLALLTPPPRALVKRLWREPRVLLKRLRRERLVFGWSIGIAVAVVLSVLWITLMRTGELVTPAAGHPTFTLAGAAMRYIINWGNTYLMGLVGVAGWFDISMPSPFYWAYIAFAGSLVVFALAVGGWAVRWRFFVIFFGAVVVPGVMQVAEANTVGFIIGGRYMLPLLVSMPLLGAFVLEREMFTARQAHSMTKLLCVALLPMHLVLLVFGMVRWQSGTQFTHLNPFGGSWHPPTGSVAPLVLMTAGLLLVGFMTWHAPPRAAAASSAQEGEAGEAPGAGTDSGGQTLLTAEVSGRSNGRSSGTENPLNELVVPR
jgi:hypothetical protein